MGRGATVFADGATAAAHAAEAPLTALAAAGAQHWRGMCTAASTASAEARGRSTRGSRGGRRRGGASQHDIVEREAAPALFHVAGTKHGGVPLKVGGMRLQAMQWR